MEETILVGPDLPSGTVQGLSVDDLLSVGPVSYAGPLEEVLSMPTVSEYLRTKGVAFDLISHTQTYTSIEEARALGLAADEVLKTVAVKTASGYALAVVPGIRRLDMKRLREAASDRHTRLATEEELERDFPDYDLGALPPIGSLLDVPMYVDPEVMNHETIVFAAGRQTESVKIRREDLLRGEPVTVITLARHPEEEERGKEQVL